MQKLIFPINNVTLTASWKTDAYKAKFKSIHYGVDMVSSKGIKTVYASGNGTVIACGADNVLGNVVAVLYNDAYNHITGRSADVICRMYHFAGISVKAMQTVTKDTVLGQYGNTGMYSAGAHLHLEIDADTKFPFYTPTLSGTSTFFKGGIYGANDKSMSNPLEWLHRKPTPPDSQTYATVGDSFIRPEDRLTVDFK